MRRSLLRSIFISYRREGSQGEAGRLFDDLVDAFTDREVFMDVDAIQPGRDFRIAIQESVQQCRVLLCVIGLDWLTCTNAEGISRLADPADFVRLEIAEALRRDIPVIPVLVRGARMPALDQLPPDLADLAFRNAVEVGHARWKSDIQVLLRALQALLGEPPETAPHGSLVSPPPHAVSQSPGIPAPEIERVSRDLAHYIGPIAEIVVKRAAKRCDSIPDLYTLLAKEIEAAPDRARFLAQHAR